MRAQAVSLSNKLDKLLLDSSRDNAEVADTYLKIFELVPHEDMGKLAALNAYAYFFALGKTDAASGLLEEIAKVYSSDETCPNVLDLSSPLRLVASAKVEKARLLAKKGLYLAAIEEISLVRRGKKAVTEGFCGMPIGDFLYFGPTEAVLDLFEAELTSNIEPTSGISRYNALLDEHKGSELAWINRQGVKYPLDVAALQMCAELVDDEAFSFERANDILQDISEKCWTDDCRAQALLSRAELWEFKPEARTRAKSTETEELLAKLITSYQDIVTKRWEAGKMTIAKPACVAAMKLAELYKQTGRHAEGSKRLADLLNDVKDSDVKGHITLAIAGLLLDIEGPNSASVQNYYLKCLTDYAYEPYYPFKEQKPKYLIDAVPENIKKELLGERTR